MHAENGADQGTATDVSGAENPFTHKLLIKVAKPQYLQLTSLRLRFQSSSLTPNTQDISVSTIVEQGAQETLFQLRIPVSRMSRLSNEVAAQYDINAGQAPQDGTLKMILVAIDQSGVEYPLVASNIGVGFNARYSNFRDSTQNPGTFAGNRGHFILRNRGALALAKLQALTPAGSKFRFNDGAMLLGGKSPDHTGHETGLKLDFHSLDSVDSTSATTYERGNESYSTSTLENYTASFGGANIKNKYKDVAILMLASSVGWLKNEEAMENAAPLLWDRDCPNRDVTACNFTLDDCVFTNTLPIANANTSAEVVTGQALRCQVIRDELATSIKPLGTTTAMPRLYAAVDRMADWIEKNNRWLSEFQTEIAPFAAGVYLRTSFGDNMKMQNLIAAYAANEVATTSGLKYSPRVYLSVVNEETATPPPGFRPEFNFQNFFADNNNPNRRAIYLRLVDDWNVRLITDGRIVLRNSYQNSNSNTDRTLEKLKSNFADRLDRRTPRDFLKIRRSNGARLTLAPINSVLANEAANHFNHLHLEIDSRRPDSGGLP